MAVEDSVAQDQLKAFISRIERMEEEKAAIAADIKEIYAEAKGNGFDTKILRKIVTIRKQDANERMEQEALLELYMDALGMEQAHQAAVNERYERHSGGRSAPLAERVESISEPVIDHPIQSFAGSVAHGVDANSSQSNAFDHAPITHEGNAYIGGLNVADRSAQNAAGEGAFNAPAANFTGEGSP